MGQRQLCLAGLILAMLLGLCHGAGARELPVFGTDREADAWLREHSAFYRTMATQVDARGGYRFTGNPGKPKAGDVHFEGRDRCIALGEGLTGGERVSIIAFEMTNAYQEKLHQEIDARAQQGIIRSPEEFGLRHEMIEYDGLRYHRRVLGELEMALQGLPRSLYAWLGPELKSFAAYELQLASAYLEAQARSGHTAHYHRWFWIQRGEAPPS